MISPKDPIPTVLLVDLGCTLGGQEIYSKRLEEGLKNQAWKVQRAAANPDLFDACEHITPLNSDYASMPSNSKKISQITKSVDIIHFNGARAIYNSIIMPKNTIFIGTKHTRYLNPNESKATQHFKKLFSPFLHYKLDKLILVSESMREELPNWLQKRSIFIPNGVPSHFDQQSHRSNAKFTMCYVGRFSPWKGVMDLLEACRILHTCDIDYNLILAGTGEQDDKMRNFVNNNKLNGKINILDFVSNPSDIFSRSHLCVLPSKFEGMPLTLLEAYSAGCPVIGYDVPGVREIIYPGISGLFATPGPEGLSQAIMQLAGDKTLLKQLSRGAKSVYHKHYTIDKMINKTIETYNALLGKT